MTLTYTALLETQSERKYEIIPGTAAGGGAILEPRRVRATAYRDREAVLLPCIRLCANSFMFLSASPLISKHHKFERKTAFEFVGPNVNRLPVAYNVSVFTSGRISRQAY